MANGYYLIFSVKREKKVKRGIEEWGKKFEHISMPVSAEEPYHSRMFTLDNTDEPKISAISDTIDNTGNPYSTD